LAASSNRRFAAQPAAASCNPVGDLPVAIRKWCNDNGAQHVRYWHLTDISAAPAFVGYWSNSGHWPALAPN
jgi:hypothetical protein